MQTVSHYFDSNPATCSAMAEQESQGDLFTYQHVMRVLECLMELPRNIMTLSLIGTGALAGGCVNWHTEDGTRHHLIIGVGLVSCKASSDQQVLATDTSAFGVTISDRPGLRIGFGYASNTVVSISSDAQDVLLELSKRPGGAITIDSQHARFGEKEDGAP